MIISAAAVFDSPRVLAGDHRGQILNDADNRPCFPFQGTFPPSEQARLIRFIMVYAMSSSDSPRTKASCMSTVISISQNSWPLTCVKVDASRFSRLIVKVRRQGFLII